MDNVIRKSVAQAVPESRSYICPQSFPSVPNIQFSDNISAPDIINRHTSRLKGFIYENVKLHVHYA